MTQLDLVTFVPLFTSIPMSPHHHIRTSLDNRFLAMQNFAMPMTTREQPYGILTSMMADLHNNASTFADNAIPYTPYNANIPSSSSIPS